MTLRGDAIGLAAALTGQAKVANDGYSRESDHQFVKATMRAVTLSAALVCILSCGFETTPAATVCPVAPPLQLPAGVTAASGPPTAVQIMSLCTEAMSKARFTVSRQTLGSPDKQFTVSPGQMSDCQIARFGYPVSMAVTSESDTSADCPRSTCYVVHVEGTLPDRPQGPNGCDWHPAFQDTWVDKISFRWLTRRLFSHGYFSNVDITDAASFR